MKNYRHSLPPLDYLVFFEAVVRHGSFTRAANELHVSQAAVSKRMKVLENLLGFPLIERNGRSIRFTPKGQKLASETNEALDYLDKSIRRMQSTKNQGLKLASNVAVSQFWLTPRINEYLLRSHPVPITLTASDKQSDMLNMENDAVIYYGTEIPLGWEGTLLFEEIWLPLIAPSISNSRSTLISNTLLDFEKLGLNWINWPDFISRTQHAGFSETHRISLGSYGNTVYAAIKGKGIALGCPDVLRNEIESGALIPLYDFQLKTQRSYFVIWKSGTMTSQLHLLLSDVGIRFDNL
jgi:LysR family glycine cleavage system transcriptional activator